MTDHSVRIVPLRTAQRREPVPDGVPAVWVEAGSPVEWRAPGRPGDRVTGVERFGASAPGAGAYARLGFAPERVADAATAIVRPTRETGNA